MIQNQCFVSLLEREENDDGTFELSGTYSMLDYMEAVAEDDVADFIKAYVELVNYLGF